jgi:predicted metal-dependent hydrolase
MGLPEPQIALTKDGRIWGKCLIPERKILLHTSLSCMPEEVIREVVLHEVCHLKRKEHDAGFWKLMDEMMEDWPEKEGILCRLGRKIRREGKASKAAGIRC